MAKKSNSAKETRVATGLMDRNGKPITETFDNDPVTMKSQVNKKSELLKSLKKDKLDEDTAHPAWVVSRLPQACPVSYCGETIIIPARCPKGKLFVKNSRMLGKLPKGVQTVAAPEKGQKKRKK